MNALELLLLLLVLFLSFIAQGVSAYAFYKIYSEDMQTFRNFQYIAFQLYDEVNS